METRERRRRADFSAATSQRAVLNFTQSHLNLLNVCVCFIGTSLTQRLTNCFPWHSKNFYRHQHLHEFKRAEDKSSLCFKVPVKIFINSFF